jgi:hypothetical protein
MGHARFITIKLLDFVHRPDFYKQKTQRTMDKVQKLNSNECYTPSSEPFRMYTLDCLIVMLSI